MKKREAILEKDWPEGHLNRFGSVPVPEYDVLVISKVVEKDHFKGHDLKIIDIKYRAGEMKEERRSSCYFKLHDDGRWYFGILVFW